MKRIISIITIFLLFLMTGCSKPQIAALPGTPGEVEVTCSIGPAPTCDLNAGQPAIYGLWIKEEDSNKGTDREIVTVSEKSVYLVENSGNSGKGSLRESFYEIQAVDWVNGVVTMMLKWVRVNGKYGGFDSPLKYMKVNIDGDTLYYSMGDEGQGIPIEAVIGPFVRK